MSQKWLDAAGRYEEANRQKALVRKNPSQERMAQTAAVVQELDRFMDSGEGEAAMKLLGAARRHLIFGEEEAGGGYATVFFINENGLQKSHEASGTWVAYSKVVLSPQVRKATAQEVVEAAVRDGNLSPESVMRWLRSNLDIIAGASKDLQIQTQ